MVDWLAVILLIVVGLVLIIIEVIFIPGTTIIGILGAIFTAVGIFISFQTFGAPVGMVVLGVSIVVSGGALFISLKSGIWKKFALKESNVGRVNEDIKPNLEIGATGIALSTLRPFGKAEFEERVYEVRSFGNYVPAGSNIRIIKIENHKIFVEPINE